MTGGQPPARPAAGNATGPATTGLADAGLPETLVPLREGGGTVPVICVPAASGSPYSYGRLAGALRGQAVYGLEAPGLQDGREPASSVSDLAAGYEGVLRQAGLGGHVHLLGWSMGAITAFELARLAASHGSRIGALLLIDPPPPEPSGMPAEIDIVGASSPTSPARRACQLRVRRSARMVT